MNYYSWAVFHAYTILAISLYSTGHWIGGTVAIAIVIWELWSWARIQTST